MSNYLLEVVANHLRFLCEEWDQNIDDESLRRSSNVLRMLLVEPNLLNAWQIAGFSREPEIVAPTLEKHLQTYSLNDILFATAGGAEYKGTTIAMLCISSEARTPEQIREISKIGPFILKHHKLVEFSESTCIIVRGLSVNRRELIKYVANKLGGDHIDLRRDLSKPLEQKFAYLDKIRETIQVAEKNAIYYEILSIGQSLVRSDDVQRLRNRLQMKWLSQKERCAKRSAFFRDIAFETSWK